MIYLDNAATTQINTEVFETMIPYLTTEYGNAGSLYSLGRKAAEAIRVARAQVASLLNCKPDNIIFTSGGSEANNLAIKGVQPYLKEHKKMIAISSISEHDSVIRALIGEQDPMKDDAYKKNYIANYSLTRLLPVNRHGVVDINALRENMILDMTGIVSIMYANNVVGSINPVKEIAEICHENGAIFHTDCVQSAGFHKLDVEEIGCDLMSISGHKIHAPKGVGALYVRDRSLLSSLISGGSAQEFGLRGGTENVAEIVGFGKACELANNYRSQSHETILQVKDTFIKELTAQVDTNRTLHNLCHINSFEYDSKVVNFRFDNIDAQTLVLMLDNEGVCVSAGSACQSHESKANRVLVAMGLTENEARQSIRVSFSELNTEREAVKAVEKIIKCVETLISLSNEDKNTRKYMAG